MKYWLTVSPPRRSVPLCDLPQLDYQVWYSTLSDCLDRKECHMAAYFGWPTQERLLLIAVVMNDATGELYLAAYLHQSEVLPSLTAVHPLMHSFERELIENFGVKYADHPWNKPLRFAHDRADRSQTINNYPFYSIRGEALHEVNVGPIHAGVIEPGCFRFICKGEQVLHLEIVLGYQHRGVERLLRETDNPLRQAVLCESIAGDSVAAHATAYARLVEAAHPQPSPVLERERAIAVEMERIALQLADTGALCMDIAYQLGQVACEALRGLVVNSVQLWCGSRFSKGLIRPGGSHFRLDEEVRERISHNLNEVQRRFKEIVKDLTKNTSVLSRFQDCGVLTPLQSLQAGIVGQAARASGLVRDLRSSHPWGPFNEETKHTPVVLTSGDVLARLQVRLQEVDQSIGYISAWLNAYQKEKSVVQKPDYKIALPCSSLLLSWVEGWRGEVVHCAITDEAGKIAWYKIKDPSQHNWMGLALAVRGIGISDFPICNKSFNLSYCGHDL